MTIFQIKKYYENEPRFYGVCSRYNLPKAIKNGAYVISLDEYAVGTHWLALFCRKTEIVYFDSFKEFIENKNIESYIFRVQLRSSIMCK